MRYGRIPAIVLLNRDSLGRLSFVVVVDNYSAVFPAADVSVGVSRVWRRLSVQLGTGDLLVRYHPQPTDLNPTFVRHNWYLGFNLGMHF